MGKASRRDKGSISRAPDNQGRRLEEELRSPQESPSKGILQETTSINKLFPFLIIILVSFAVYFNAIFGDFVYDDNDQIVQNPWIRDIGNIPTIFSKSVWGFQSQLVNFYRPLMHLIFTFNYYVFGLRPWGFHLVNILFHCGASVLVFLIIRRLLSEHRATASSVYLSPPFIAAMLFASYPIHTEAVTWISGLPDVAFTFFYLLSLYLYMLFRDGAKRCYVASVLSFSVATLFKEPALTLPIILIVYDRQMTKSDMTLITTIKRYIPYMAVSIIYLLGRYYALGGFAPIETHSLLSTYQSTINIFPLFTEYLASLLWPFNLNLWHSFHPVSSLFDAKGITSILVTVIFFIATSAAHKKNKMLFFGLLLLIIPLLPAFYIKGISGGKPFAERYLYLPSTGFVLVLAVFLSWIIRKRPNAIRVIPFIFMVTVMLYAAGTISRNNVWKNDFTLWSDTVKKSPREPMAYDALGLAYASKGLVDMAIEQYEIALRLRPDYAEAHNNLGIAYLSKGQFDMAIEQYQTSVGLKPDNLQAYNNLGNAYLSTGQFDKAIEQYQTALRLRPDYVEAHFNLGGAYRSKGQFDKAIEQYQTTLRLRPDYVEAHFNLGGAYRSKGQFDKAIERYQTTLRLRPDYVEAHNDLGTAYSSKGLFDMAIEQYLVALRLKPNFVEVHYNLGNAYSSKGLFDMAIEQYQTALRLKPDYAEAHFNLGLIYLRNNSKDLAKTEFELGLKNKPDARQILDSIILNNSIISK